MKSTLGTRLRASRQAMNMTQEELANKLLTKKSTISAYENDLIDIKTSVICELASLLGTTVGYLLVGDEDKFSPDIMRVALLLQGIPNDEIRRVAIEQVKLLAGLNVNTN